MAPPTPSGKSTPHPASPAAPAAGTAQPGGKKKKSKKGKNLEAAFASWRRLVDAHGKASAVVKVWLDRLPQADAARKPLGKLVDALDGIDQSAMNALPAWSALSDAKFEPPKLKGAAHFVKGSIVKLKPKDLKEMLERGCDESIWGGEFAVTAVHPSMKGILYLHGHSVEHSSVGFPGMPSFKFVLVR